MDLDTTTLKECRLGPIVLFYTKTPRVTPSITRSAEALVQTWSRPIIKRPANFRSMHVETAAEAEERVESLGEAGMNESLQGVPKGVGGGRKRFDVRQALRENANRKGARIPVIPVSLAFLHLLQERCAPLLSVIIKKRAADVF